MTARDEVNLAGTPEFERAAALTESRNAQLIALLRAHGIDPAGGQE